MTGHTATVFGATGFLGRYIVNRLGAYQQIRWEVVTIHLTSLSPARMHSRCPVQRRDGKETSESLRRPRTSRLYCTLRLTKSLVHTLNQCTRNTIYGTHSQSKRLFDIQTSYTIWLGGIILQSEDTYQASFRFETDETAETSIWRMFMWKELSVSPKLLPSTTLTDLSTSPLTTSTRNHHQSSSDQKYVIT